MPNNPAIKTASRIANRLKVVGLVSVVLAVCGLASALLWQIESADGDSQAARRKRFVPSPATPRDVDALLVKMAGRVLIRPAQVKAAVKDTGAAARLVKQLKLRGVVEMPDGLVAYIELASEGVRDVRKGDRVLVFEVKDLQPGAVTLTLDGVEVQLKN